MSPALAQITSKSFTKQAQQVAPLKSEWEETWGVARSFLGGEGGGGGEEKVEQKVSGQKEGKQHRS